MGRATWVGECAPRWCRTRRIRPYGAFARHRGTMSRGRLKWSPWESPLTSECSGKLANGVTRRLTEIDPTRQSVPVRLGTSPRVLLRANCELPASGAIVVAKRAGRVWMDAPASHPTRSPRPRGCLTGWISRRPRAASPPGRRHDPAACGVVFDGETQTRTGDTTIFSHPLRAARSPRCVGLPARTAPVAAPATSPSTWSDGDPSPEDAAAGAASSVRAERDWALPADAISKTGRGDGACAHVGARATIARKAPVEQRFKRRWCPGDTGPPTRARCLRRPDQTGDPIASTGKDHARHFVTPSRS